MNISNSPATTKKISRGKKGFQWFFSNYFMFVVLIGMFIICGIISPVFLSVKNFFNLLGQNSVFGIMAIGMSFLIIAGMLDLSAGSTVGLAGVAGAVVTVATGDNYILGILAGLAAGAAVGALNGLLVTKVKINFFITTLGTMTVFRGLTLVCTNGIPITGLNQDVTRLGMGTIGGLVPIAFIVWAALVIIFQFVLKCTKYGQYVYAMGGNPRASWLSGINVNKYTFLTFVLAGLFAGIGAVVLTSRVKLAAPDAGTGYELKVIAGCIIGGIALNGGKGDIINSVIGIVILGLILNILNLAGVSSYYTDVITGIIIIIAVAVSGISRLKKD